MDLIDKLTELSSRIKLLSKEVRTEEAVKTAFVLPFIQALGYDVFNPMEVVPEHVVDHGVKKGEKVDYAIRIGGLPMILIECKQIGAPLEYRHASQLFRYFTVSEAKFGVLTDGVKYLFYTDLDAVNKMDERPFLEFDLTTFDESAVTELKRFVKGVFHVENIQRSASVMKTRKILLNELRTEFASPSEDLIKLLFARVNPGARFTGQAREPFAALVRQALDTFLQETVNGRLQAAMVTIPQVALMQDSEVVQTTAKEMEAFKILQAICSEITSPNDVVLRDAKSYCAVLYQDNNRKPLARLYFNREANLQVGLFTDEGETKQNLMQVEDLYQYKSVVLAKLAHYKLVAEAPGSSVNQMTGTPASNEVSLVSVTRFSPTRLGG